MKRSAKSSPKGGKNLLVNPPHSKTHLLSFTAAAIRAFLIRNHDLSETLANKMDKENLVKYFERKGKYHVLPRKSPKRVLAGKKAAKTRAKTLPKRVAKGVAKKASPKKASPKKVSPKKVSPKKVSPKKVSPKKASPKKASPKKTMKSRIVKKKETSISKYFDKSFIDGIKKMEEKLFSSLTPHTKRGKEKSAKGRSKK